MFRSTVDLPFRARRLRVWHGVAAVAIAMVTTVVAFEAVGWTPLRVFLQSRASAAAGSTVQVDGAFRLRLLWNPGIEAERLRVAAAPGFVEPLLFDATGVQWRWRWMDLLRWWGGDTLRIESLQADTLVANLERHADGRASWQLHRLREAEPGGRRGGLPQFGVLRMGSGRVRLIDATKGHDLLLQVRGKPGGFDAGYDARLNGHYRQLPVDLALLAGGPLPLLLDESSATRNVPLRIAGTAGPSQLLIDGSAASLITTQRLEGALHFKGPSLAAVGDPVGLTLPRTPPFDIRGRIGHNATVWHLQADQAVIGNSRLGGSFDYDNRQQPRRLTGRLTGQRLLLADLGPAVGTNGPGVPRPEVRVLPQRRFDLPSLHTLEADIAVALDELDFGGRALEPFRDVTTRLTLHDGVLRLDALQAVAGGGRMEGWTQYDTRRLPAAWTVDLAFAKVDLGSWIKGLRKDGNPGGAAGGATYLTGDMSGRLRLQGRGGSTAEILSTLDGSVQARLADGSVSQLLTELAGLDVAQALGVAVRGDSALPMRCAIVDMAVTDGVIVPSRAVFDSRDTTVAIKGRIDLRDETLDLQASARPKDFTPLSLRTPVTVKGTLSHPRLGVEAAPLAGRVLAAVGLGLIAGPAALLPFVDPGSRPKTDPCA